MKTKKLIPLIIISLWFTEVYCQREKLIPNVKDYDSIHQVKKQQRKQLDGSILTDLNFEDIDGESYSLKSLRGKVVVFNFWFIQCKPCVKELPDLNKLQQKFQNKDVEFFAVSWNDKSSLEKFVAKNQLDYKVVSDKKLIDKFNISYYPSHVLIDQYGNVEYVNDLLSFNIFKKIERKIYKFLK